MPAAERPVVRPRPGGHTPQPMPSTRTTFLPVTLFAVALITACLVVVGYGVFDLIRPHPSGLRSPGGSFDPVQAAILGAALLLAVLSLGLLRRNELARWLIVVFLWLGATVAAFNLLITVVVVLAMRAPPATFVRQFGPLLGFYLGFVLAFVGGALFLSSPRVRCHFRGTDQHAA